MTLTLVQRLDIDRHRSVGVGRDPRRSPVLEATNLHIGGNADSEEAPFGPRFGFLPEQRLVVGHFEELVEGLLVLAGVEDIPPGGFSSRGCVRELLGRDEVAAPHLGRVDAGGPGDLVDYGLDRQRRLRAAGAPVDPSWRPVGPHPAHPPPVDADVVVPGPDPGSYLHERQVAVTTAEVDQDVDPQGLDPPVLGCDDLPPMPLGTTVADGGHVLASGLGPLHRTAREARGVDHEVLLLGGVELGAEPATHERRDDANRGLRHAQVGGELLLHEVRGLGRDVDHEAAVLPLGDDGPGLHRGRNDTRMLDDSGETDRSRRRIEGRTVTLGTVVRHVVGLALMDRRGGQCLVDVTDRVERVVIDEHRLGRVSRLRRSLGHDRGDRIARHEDDTLSQRIPARDVSGRIGSGRHVDTGDVLGSDHGHNPGHLLRSGGVHRTDPGVGERGAHDREVEGAGRQEIVDVGGRTGDECRILPPLYGRADKRRDLCGGHGPEVTEPARSLEEAEDRGAEVVGLEGLGNEGVCAALIGPAPGFLLSVSGEHHDRDAFGGVVPPDAVEDFPAVHPGESDVEDHEVGRLGADGV